MMNPLHQSALIQRIIKIIDQKKPSWYTAQEIVKVIILPELERVKDEFVRLFYSDSDKNH